jgi:carbamoyltransferase
MLYSAFTYFLGFKVNSDEYKLMGLAPYGERHSEQTTKYIRLIEENIVNISSDGSITLNMKYFAYDHSLVMIDERNWETLFGINRREEKSIITQSHKNLAYAIQYVLEKIIRLLCSTLEKYSKNPLFYLLHTH